MTHPLDELAALVEKAEGPDRELDAAIMLAIGWTAPQQQGSCGVFYARRELYDWHDEKGVARGFYPPRLTASLDAAMTLAEGMILVQMSDIAADGLPAVCLCSDTSTTPPTEHWGIAFASGPRREQLARSYVAASLRARAAGGEG